jgi:DNA-binding NtrC family response regulator
MTASGREKWLILDDAASDRRRMKMAVESDTVEAVLTSTVTEALEILEKQNVSVCLLDFFLRGTNSAKLVSEIRSRFSAMPIIVVSSHAGREQSIYKAGADSVVPKVTDLDAFAKIVLNAVGHAKAIRTSKAVTCPLRSLRFSAFLAQEFRRVAATQRGNVIVVSEPGMGRTSVARALAEELHAATFARCQDVTPTRRRLLTYVCSAEASAEEVDAALFGTETGAPGMIAGAQDGILIIDDVHFLPEEMREKLKTLVLRRKLKANNGKILWAQKMRLVLTTVPAFRSQEFVTNFETPVAQHALNLPSPDEILNDARELVEFFFTRAINKRALKPERGLIGEIAGRMSTASDRITLRSVVRAIEEATTLAASEGRERILETDFGGFEGLYDSAVTPSPRETRELLLASDDKVGVTSWRHLYEVIRTGSFEEAEEVVRKMMVEYAMIRFRGNKTKVAAQLGVARQYLYKPNLRDFHLLD